MNEKRSKRTIAAQEGPPEPAGKGSKQHWLGRTRQRVPHNVVERRYRENLNGQIEALRSTIPPALNGCPGSRDIEEGAVKMPSKAEVISNAQSYIKALEAERMRLLAEVNGLKEQVRDLSSMVNCDDCSVINYITSLRVSPDDVYLGDRARRPVF
jgi:hypothetical protein